MSYTKIEAPDLRMLERISEQQVCEWMAARLEQLRTESKFPIHSMGMTVQHHVFGKPEFSISFGMHCSGKCSISEPSTTAAFNELRNDLLDNPAKKAAEARAEAKALLKEAEHFEKLAASNQPLKAVTA